VATLESVGAARLVWLVATWNSAADGNESNCASQMTDDDADVDDDDDDDDDDEVSSSGSLELGDCAAAAAASRRNVPDIGRNNVVSAQQPAALRSLQNGTSAIDQSIVP